MRLWIWRGVLVLAVPVMVIALAFLLTVAGVVFAVHAAYRVYGQAWDDLEKP